MRPRPVKIEGDIVRIPLTQGKTALIDVCDLDIVKDYNWYAAKSRNVYYAQRMERRVGRKAIKLHRALLSPPEGYVVDHINGDGLDNRRCNLRIATQQENHQNQITPKHNTSGVKGVSWHSRDLVWYANIRVSGRLIYIGKFRDFEAACAARLEAERRYFGEFANRR